jgi:hypothetical protein
VSGKQQLAISSWLLALGKTRIKTQNRSSTAKKTPKAKKTASFLTAESGCVPQAI